MAGITLDGVTKRFSAEVTAVDDVSLEIGDGEFMVLVGPSGCGKSTLLRMIAGLEEVTDGRIDIGDERGHRPAAEGSRHRDGLPELRALPAHDRRAEPRLRPQAAQDAEGRDPPPRRRGREHPRPRGPAEAQARRALGRPAPARRDGPRHGARAAGLPDGRAALEPRRQAARADARRARAAARPPQDDHRLRDARPGRGDDARRSRGRHARRPACSRSTRRRSSTGTRRTCSSPPSSARPR